MASKTQRTMMDLRGHLFDVIEQLKKPKGLDVQRANAICTAAGRLIQTAEVEIKYRGLIGQEQRTQPSAFLTDQRA